MSINTFLADMQRGGHRIALTTDGKLSVDWARQQPHAHLRDQVRHHRDALIDHLLHVRRAEKLTTEPTPTDEARCERLIALVNEQQWVDAIAVIGHMDDNAVAQSMTAFVMAEAQDADRSSIVDMCRRINMTCGWVIPPILPTRAQVAEVPTEPLEATRYWVRMGMWRQAARRALLITDAEKRQRAVDYIWKHDSEAVEEAMHRLQHRQMKAI